VISYFHEAEFEIWAGFGAVLGWLAVLIFFTNPAFEGSLFYFLGQNKTRAHFTLYCSQ
jgi:hypothetical protein